MSRYAREHPDSPDLWDNPVVPVRAFPPKCLCSHAESQHGTDRRDRFRCFNAVCGCVQFRPKETP